MSETILEMLSARYSSTKFETIVNQGEGIFNEIMELALQNHIPASWRAAFICHHQTSPNDPLLLPFLSRIIDAIPSKKDGHQRELLRLLLKMDINEDLEGKLFDVCVTIWESVEKSPSVRIIAFRIIVRIGLKHPEMKNEISFLTQSHYIESLSPGIKRSLEKEIEKMGK